MAERSSGLDDWRFERKFVTDELEPRQVEALLYLHPAAFSEVHAPRQVNNVYLDSLGLDAFHANLEGLAQRTKWRLRWYGGLLGLIGRPTLEIKRKRGLLGRKETYPVPPLRMDESFDSRATMEALLKHDLPESVRLELSLLEPTLLNHYRRRYFVSGDGVYRVTVDTDLGFHRLHRSGNSFLERAPRSPLVVVELKYHREDGEGADRIANAFPFRLSRSSKYVQGIERVLPW